MLAWLRQLDALLRGHSTDPAQLQRGAIELNIRRFVILSLALGAIYGFFMGWYTVLTRDSSSAMQLLSSTLKLPLLFLLTLGISFPSLYVFSALSGCRLTFTAVLRLLVGTITVNLAVAASMGPILGFFTLSTTSYSFMIILNVTLLGLAGIVSLGFLLKALSRLAAAMTPATPSYLIPSDYAAYTGSPAESSTTSQVPPPLPRRIPSAPAAPPPPGHAVFYVWIIIYSLVGAQMGWLLRPFIGNPNLPFQWFRARSADSGNFFQSVWAQLHNLFGFIS